MPVLTRRRSRWMVYALGGGLGHLTRATALARAAMRNGSDSPEICVLTNSPFARHIPFDDELGPPHTLVRLSPTLTRDETAAQVAALLTESPIDVLIVDTFPRGLGGELQQVLSQLTCRKVLVHRDLNPRYCEAFDVVESVGQYDLLIVPGEQATYDALATAIKTAPWLIRDQNELQSPSEALRNLRADDHMPVVAVMGCGRADEIRETKLLSHGLAEQFGDIAQIRFVSPVLCEPAAAVASGQKMISVNMWPFFESIAGVAIVVGSGGYNTVNETRATGTPLVGIARERLYDRQARRLNQTDAGPHNTSVSHQVADALKSLKPDMDHMIRFENGTHQAAELIHAL